MQWHVLGADVKTAFLQGSPQDRVLYVQLPPDAARLLGIPDHPCMLLRKPMYGQTDAPRAWYLEAKARLLKCGLTMHPLDPCLFLAHAGAGKLLGMVSVHVDDMLITGSPGEFSTFTDRIKTAFEFRSWKSLDDAPLTYCGGQIARAEQGITLSFQDYLKKGETDHHPG